MASHPAGDLVPSEVLAAAARGWPVFPCHSAPGGKCSCGNPECKHTGKHPRTQHGLLDATTDGKQLQIWAKKWPGCNWAVATGSKSGVFVLDVDGEEGRASLARLQEQHGQLPLTLASRTGREDGGEQWWFVYPVNCVIRNSTSKLGEGLDIRGEGGYAIVPPSVHETGRTYQWINPDTPIAEAPDWMKQPKVATNQRHESGHTVPEGRRNTTLASIAGRMRRSGASEDEIRAELGMINERNCRPPLPDDQVWRIARSVARYDPTAIPDSRLPLHDFVRAAIDKNGLDFACRQKWLSPLFVFARSLKGRGEFAASEGYRAAQTLDPVLTDLFGAPDPWQRAFGDISGDPRAELIRTWDCVQSSSDGDALTIARESALRFALRPLRSYSSLYSEFISMVGHLQRQQPGQAVAIPIKRIGILLGCHHTMVSQYRRWAEGEGILTKTAEYTAKQWAAEYNFAVDQFDWLTGEQHEPLSPDGQLSPWGTLTRESVPNSHQKGPFSPSHGDSGVSGENVPDDTPNTTVQITGLAHVAVENTEMQIDTDLNWMKTALGPHQALELTCGQFEADPGRLEIRNVRTFQPGSGDIQEHRTQRIELDQPRGIPDLARTERIPALPPGVRLIRWEPKAAPIQLSRCLTVADVDKFVRSTLRQVEARLNGKGWLAGGWTLSTLLERLEACGCLVELDSPSQEVS